MDRSHPQPSAKKGHFQIPFEKKENRPERAPSQKPGISRSFTRVATLFEKTPLNREESDLENPFKVLKKNGSDILATLLGTIQKF